MHRVADRWQEKEVWGAGGCAVAKTYDAKVECCFGWDTLTTQDTDQEHGSAPYELAARAGGHMSTTSKRAQGGLTVRTTLRRSQMGPVTILTPFWITLWNRELLVVRAITLRVRFGGLSRPWRNWQT